MEYKILWVGAISWLKNGVFTPPVRYPGIVSASTFQQAMIEGLENQGQSVRILSDSDVFDGTRVIWNHNKSNEYDVRVAGKENRILRLPVKTINLIKEIRKKGIARQRDVVVAYEMHIPYLFAIRKLKKEYNITTILICPDLTAYMDVDIEKKPIKRIFKIIENQMMKHLLKYVDGYVFFTAQMAELFTGKLHKPYTVVEGVLNEEKYDYSACEKQPFIMHSGSLHSKMGIEELVTAFKELKDLKQDLLFFGSGEMDEYICQEGKKDPRIKHMGFVSPQELFSYEKKASLLVNVRSPKEEYTKYSFPSKTFEFMASGTPVLSTDMPGIPEEYKQNMIIIPDNNKDTIKSALSNFFALSEAEQIAIGLKAQRFVRTEKNAIKQSKKIIELIEQLER